MKKSYLKKKIGNTGEGIACRFLMRNSFEIIARNYRKKWGEIDIIARKKNRLHFVEVKTRAQKISEEKNISHETTEKIRPEENVHPWKLKRLSRTIISYLIEKNVSPETLWQLDVIAVFLDVKNKKAKIRFTENIIL